MYLSTCILNQKNVKEENKFWRLGSQIEIVVALIIFTLDNNDSDSDKVSSLGVTF